VKITCKNVLTLVLAMTLPVLAGQASAGKSAAELGEEGIRAYEIGDLVPGMDLMNQAAEQGYAPAQVRLGYIFDKSEDDELSVQWYRRAADAGDAAGQLGLSGMYGRGEGVEQSDDEALRLLQASVGQNHPPALRVYAAAIEQGKFGLSVDNAKALKLYGDAASSGDRIATTRLVYANRNGELGLTADPAQAAKWEKKLND